jgi:hypothetical protein
MLGSTTSKQIKRQRLLLREQLTVKVRFEVRLLRLNGSKNEASLVTVAFGTTS